MRLYVPATVADLADPQQRRERVASAVTPALRAALPEEDEEGLELSAFLTAADLAVAEIARAAAPLRRVVLALDLPEPTAPPPAEIADLPSVVGVVDFSWRDVAAIHIDDDDAATADLVARAASDAVALEQLGDVDLLWFDPTELGALQAALSPPDGGSA